MRSFPKRWIDREFLNLFLTKTEIKVNYETLNIPRMQFYRTALFLLYPAMFSPGHYEIFSKHQRIYSLKSGRQLWIGKLVVIERDHKFSSVYYSAIRTWRIICMTHTYPMQIATMSVCVLVLITEQWIVKCM